MQMSTAEMVSKKEILSVTKSTLSYINLGKNYFTFNQFILKIYLVIYKIQGVYKKMEKLTSKEYCVKNKTFDQTEPYTIMHPYRDMAS